VLALLAFISVLIALVVHLVKAGSVTLGDVMMWLLLSLVFLTAHLALKERP